MVICGECRGPSACLRKPRQVQGPNRCVIPGAQNQMGLIVHPNMQRVVQYPGIYSFILPRFQDEKTRVKVPQSPAGTHVASIVRAPDDSLPCQAEPSMP